LRKFQPKIF